MRYLIILSILFFIDSSVLSQVYLEQNSNVTASLTSAHTTNYGGTAWVCGYNGTVIRTSNGGTNWINVTGNGIPTNVNLINIYGINNSKAITAGYIGTNTYVYRTSNSGLNWIQVFSQPNGFINAVWIVDTARGFIYGDPVGGRWSLWKTTNGGVNWDSSGMYLQQNGSETGWNNALFCRNTKIWFGTNNSRIYYSTNFGTNWVVQSTAPEQNSYSIWFYWFWNDTNWGLAGGSTLLQTSNQGLNWVPMTSSGSGNFGGFTGNPPGVASSGFPYGTFWYVRSDNKIYFSFGGTSWGANYTAPSGSYNNLSLGIQTGIAFAVRNNGGITRIITQWGGVKNISSDIPSDFKLHQNYPNPFNPKSNIRFEIPKSGNLQLMVLDALGRVVAILVNEFLRSGTYEVVWDASNYASGLYFYKLITDEFIETRKMVLIK